MQNYNYKTLNYNDYTTTRSSSISTSTSTSTTSTSTEETEKRLLTPDTQKLIKEIKQLYHDAIGSYPTVIICKAIIKDIEGKVYSMKQLEYALQETAFAPRPSWAYAAAILRRLQAEDGLPF